MKNISIFCGAHEGKNPEYAKAAKSVAEAIAKKGINVVFGGGNVGLMKIISDTALDNGVDVLGGAFIVLPGGVGSLDELAEIMASNQLGIINKPVGILNTEGYYDHLLSWFKKAVEEGFISSANLNELLVSDSPNQLVEMVVNHQRPSDDDWTKRLGL